MSEVLNVTVVAAEPGYSVAQFWEPNPDSRVGFTYHPVIAWRLVLTKFADGTQVVEPHPVAISGVGSDLEDYEFPFAIRYPDGRFYVPINSETLKTESEALASCLLWSQHCKS